MRQFSFFFCYLEAVDLVIHCDLHRGHLFLSFRFLICICFFCTFPVFVCMHFSWTLSNEAEQFIYLWRLKHLFVFLIIDGVQLKYNMFYRNVTNSLKRSIWCCLHAVLFLEELGLAVHLQTIMVNFLIGSGNLIIHLLSIFPLVPSLLSV